MSYSSHLSDMDKKMYRMVYEDHMSSNGRIERRPAIVALIELGLEEEEIERRFRTRVAVGQKLEEVSEMEYGAWLELAAPDPSEGIDLSALEINEEEQEAVQKLRQAWSVLVPDAEDTVDFEVVKEALQSSKPAAAQELEADKGSKVSFSEFKRVMLK